ncbi:hypothetical protein RN001_001891 [Aquatica leii]|uniref:Uncharacterized protein n=1 Tax=Aquatica leii TaxID=1421715 RepID=A0AAN7QAQ8_9COLE|nr:hypothetical protein RN001_001891 [Aquatica leii]
MAPLICRRELYTAEYCSINEIKENLKSQVYYSTSEERSTILKSKSKGYQTKKAKTFDPKDEEQFINKAPDEKYLLMNMVMVMGFMGALCCDELVNLRTSDIDDKRSILVISVPKTKNYKPRFFVVTGANIVRYVLVWLIQIFFDKSYSFYFISLFQISVYIII